MFEQDYIMRMIKDMIRALLKMLFDIDTDSPSFDMVGDAEVQSRLLRLSHMVDDGDIINAQNEICKITSDDDMQNLKTALFFYAYLNEKDDDFLTANGYSRDEIETGIRELAEKYQVTYISNLFE